MATCDLCNNKSNRLSSHKVFAAREDRLHNSDVAYELKEIRIYNICRDCAKAPFFYRFFFKGLPFLLAGFYLIIITFVLFPPLLYRLAPLTQPLIGIILNYVVISIPIGIYLLIYLLLPSRREIFNVNRKIVRHYKKQYQTENGNAPMGVKEQSQLKPFSVFTESEWKQLQNRKRIVESD